MPRAGQPERGRPSRSGGPSSDSSRCSLTLKLGSAIDVPPSCGASASSAPNPLGSSPLSVSPGDCSGGGGSASFNVEGTVRGREWKFVEGPSDTDTD
eukprot:2544485-Prymnesium_polylepis.1